MGKRTEYTIAERVQALAMHATGKKPVEIEAIVGMHRESFKTVLKRAKQRGYVVGGKIEERHVESLPRSGRPTKASTAVVAATTKAKAKGRVTKPKITRKKSAQPLKRSAEGTKEEVDESMQTKDVDMGMQTEHVRTSESGES